jgi:hypothetical protein
VCLHALRRYSTSLSVFSDHAYNTVMSKVAHATIYTSSAVPSQILAREIIRLLLPAVQHFTGEPSTDS